MKKLKRWIAIMCSCLFATAFFVACSSNSTPESEGKKIEILSPESEVVPYLENVVNYLKAGSSADVHDYTSDSVDAFFPVSIKWKHSLETADSFLVEYSVNDDFSESISVTVDGNQDSLSVYNLLKATKYYLRVTALNDGDTLECAESTFTTTDIGPRVMRIDGIYNVRDVGGYLTASGERTAQGLLFRGGALSDSTDPAYHYVALNEDGQKYMSETLQIKTDFDLRTSVENLGLKQSPIPGATLEYYGIGGYLSAFSDRNGYRKVFSALADESKYPIYLHCTGGADRTGTVSFLINALLGVDETVLIQDYEFTTFSIYGERNSQGTVYDFGLFLEKLKLYKGKTLAEKTETYMKAIGVTEDEIYNIKAIMLGKPCRPTVTAQEKFVSQKDSELIITIGKVENIGKIDQVIIADTEIPFAVQGNKIVIAKTDIPNGLRDGTVDGSVIIDGQSYSFSFEYDGQTHISALSEGNGSIMLNESNLSVTGRTAIGYEGAIAELKISALTEINYGSVYFMIGSYGVRFRGDLFRASVLKDQYAEYSPRIEMNSRSHDVFNQEGGATIGLSVKIKNQTTVTITVYVNDVKVGSADVARIANEIAEENALFTVCIESEYVSELRIENVAGE